MYHTVEIQAAVIPAKAGIRTPVIPAKAGIQTPVIPAKAGIQKNEFCQNQRNARKHRMQNCPLDKPQKSLYSCYSCSAGIAFTVIPAKAGIQKKWIPQQVRNDKESSRKNGDLDLSFLPKQETPFCHSRAGGNPLRLREKWKSRKPQVTQTFQRVKYAG